jgi:hypothetical protein
LPPRQGRSRHALLPQDKGGRGEPFLPQVGELYLVETTIYTLGTDPAADRRAVVITVPPDPSSKRPIQLVTRTSKKAPGVAHPVDLSIGCDRDGVFSDLVSVEQQLWRPGNVVLLGVLPEPYLSLVLERFG